MNFSWRGYRALTLATLKMQWRNPWGALISVAVTVAILAALHFASGGPLFGYRVGLVNNSRAPDAQLFVSSIEGITFFKVYEMTDYYAQLNFDSGAIDMSVVIPDTVGLGTGTSTVEVAYRSGPFSETALALLQSATDQFNVTESKSAPATKLDATTPGGSALGQADTLLPGLISLQLISGALIAAAALFAAYRSSGVLRRIQATGVGPSTFVFSHATSSLVVGTIQVIALLVAAAFIFSIQYDPLAVFCLTLLAYLTFLALGLGVAGVVRNAQASSAIASVIGAPLILLGFVPTQLLPVPLSTVLGLLPVDMYTDGLHRAALGAGIGGVAGDLLGMLVWSAAFLVLASRLFRWDD